MCVIEVKPQLEKLLNLPYDCLAKEIELTQKVHVKEQNNMHAHISLKHARTRTSTQNTAHNHATLHKHICAHAHAWRQLCYHSHAYTDTPSRTHIHNTTRMRTQAHAQAHAQQREWKHISTGIHPNHKFNCVISCLTYISHLSVDASVCRVSNSIGFALLQRRPQRGAAREASRC